MIQRRRIFQALVVHNEAFNQVFLQRLGGPLAELCASRSEHDSRWRNDGQAIVKCVAIDLSLAFLLNL
jgi:hypothetical protein